MKKKLTKLEIIEKLLNKYTGGIDRLSYNALKQFKGKIKYKI